MTSDAGEKNRTESEWQLGHSRFSIFSGGYAALEASDFEDIFGFAVENETNRKAQFLTEFSTTRGQALYQLTVAGPKIDLQISVVLQTDEVPNRLPVLEDRQMAREQVLEAAVRLSEKVADVRRMAVGEQTLIPVTSRVSAYDGLSKFLPAVKIDSKNSSDFFYRINRPRRIDLDGRQVLVNRLSQWAVLQLNVTVKAAEMSKMVFCGDAVSLLTDINSAAEEDLSGITGAQKQQLIEALFAFSNELSEKGDCP